MAMLPRSNGQVGGERSLPLRQSSSFSDTSDADDVFNNTLNTTDGGDCLDENTDLIPMQTVPSSSAIPPPENIAPQQQKQVTTYQIDTAKQHPMSAEHANKNGYVKMGDNGVIAVFCKNPAPSMPKVEEEN